MCIENIDKMYIMLTEKWFILFITKITFMKLNKIKFKSQFLPI